MNDMQLPKIFGEIALEIDNVSEIAAKLRNIDVRAVSESEKLNITEYIDRLAKHCVVAKHLIEIYVSKTDKNPEYIGFRNDISSPIGMISGYAELLSFIDWNDAEFTQNVKDLVWHSNSLLAIRDSLNTV